MCVAWQGIKATPFEKTVDGFESQFQVNHLADFLLTHHLLPLLTSTGKARVVNLSSRAHLRW
jgi:NAD(P)-dependent dehydrogenase (short-subunit alcohol dehydrogenase family)